MENTLVSVIIPVYNAEKSIKKAVSSVLNQSYRNFEIIVVDDCSSDNTKNILNSIKDKRLKIIHLDKNSGSASKPKNKGIKYAKGDFLAFLDSDDYWQEYKLEKQLKLFDDENVSLVYSDGAFFGDGPKNSKKFSDFSKFYRGGVFRKLILKNFIPSSSVVVRKESIEEKHFSESLKVGEDYDVWLQIAKDTKIDYCPETLFYYHESSGSLSSDKKKSYSSTQGLYKRWLKKDLSFFEKITFRFSCFVLKLKKIKVSSRVQSKS